MKFDYELQCLTASYSSEELEVLYSGKSETLLKFMIQPNTSLSPQSTTINIVFKIPSLYPSVIPEISVSFSSFTNYERKQIENEVREHALTLIGSPMIMELVMWTKDKVNEVLITKQESTNLQNTCIVEEELFLIILGIDHMRSKCSYVKTLKAWTSDLNVNGALLFCQKRIFLILQGLKHSVKTFTMRLKTTCVDVDSSGKKCKEKMSKILFEGSFKKCYDTFSVEEFNSFIDLEQHLVKKGLNHISSFKEYFINK